MNRKLLALAVGAALATPLAAQAAPTVYGKLNASVDYIDGDSADQQWEVNSNSSRIGVKGEENLGSNLSAVYMAEWGVSVDGSSGDLSSRNRYVGLKHADLGTLRLGRFDSAFKTAEGYVDVFNDLTYTDMEMAIGISGQDRLSNVIGYTSPKIGNAFTVEVDLHQGENVDGHGIGDGVSASATYEQNGLYLSLGLNKDEQDAAHDTPSASRDGVRLVGVYTMGDIQLGALLQDTRRTHDDQFGDLDEQAILLSGSYKMDKCVFKGELGHNTIDNGSDTDINFIGVGLDHNFTANTKAFGVLAYQNVQPPVGDDINNTVFTVGLETKF